MNRPVNVYAELTPNPNSLKFVADVLLLQGGTVEYSHPAEADACPLAQQLFQFSGVEKVFISSNFITINKSSDIDWFDITQILREFIRGYLMSDEKLFLENPSKKEVSVALPAEKDSSPLTVDLPDDPEAEQQIIRLLEEYIRPAVEGDGGAIDFHSFQNGVVRVIMKGACSGCPSSTLTLKSGIENLLKKMVPSVREVMAISQ